MNDLAMAQGSSVTIRPATLDDLEGIRVIYNHAVVHTTAIWNDVQVDLENRRQWFEARMARGFPVLVAVAGDQVVGYAAYGDWRPFDGFRHSVENSVYVAPGAQGRGIGEALLRALVDCAHERGVHRMIAAIASENAISIALHAKVGFRTAGVFSEAGTKFGRWLDLTFMELAVGRGRLE
ncbi:GNAT family N-acetyltransferase [Nitrospirillum sp. BR 11163]|uniref:GNAT family N-acetyltransferase n=1 Tax=Nitrospirillum sp. BR 11163 TaxID=3104323 RepID=UPI002B003D3B|nr:GNAT family N-acetyltransferase [Nitrospirillum sp. BR 11163]MEA1671786.1 N-acetyltransferase family protein [Nitrospirillum sp. BR 11163]